jgi:sigma-B regulation protein RsbU (phosphoserine phosphatase)
VGGDLYDFFIRDEKLFFCIGDVSGKGIPASLVMAVTRTTFRNMSAREDSPGRIVSQMNDNLASMNDNNMFVTLFCGVLNLTTGLLRYCNAGHNPPVSLSDSMRMLPVQPNIALGILKGMVYNEQEILMYPDDAIFLYTDGLNEAENAAHEQFGEERMMNALHGRKPSQDHLDNILGQVAHFVGDAPQSDDLTMLFIHYLGKDSTAPRKLTLHNNICEISRLWGFVEAIADEGGLDPALTASINLALEEAVTNVIEYAYPNGTDGTVDVEAYLGPKILSFTISDSGMPFDPTARAEVDITAGVEERPIGGLGIHLIRRIMDSVKYKRKNDMNILTITKNL